MSTKYDTANKFSLPVALSVVAGPQFRGIWLPSIRNRTKPGNWPAIPLEHLRDHILGDDELMWYCLEKAGRAAIEKGDEPCRELLEHLDCNLFEQIKADCGDNPQAMVKELLHHVQPLWMHDELDE